MSQAANNEQDDSDSEVRSDADDMSEKEDMLASSRQSINNSQQDFHSDDPLHKSMSMRGASEKKKIIAEAVS